MRSCGHALQNSNHSQPSPISFLKTKNSTSTSSPSLRTKTLLGFLSLSLSHRTTMASPAPAPFPLPTPQPSLGHFVIPALTKLQEILSQLGEEDFTIDLPQVAAIGSQGSGKSSVVESLVGRDFLPRGVKTRRPVVIQLVRNPGEEEWGEFDHLSGKRFYDFEKIKKEIQIETDREMGTYNYISEKEIRLKVFSPNVPDITLVDLPGVSKVPVGDQPSDIQMKSRDLTISYIKQPRCIILAISPANEDLTNSDALQLARLVDPQGSRTIGVITKLDIMDRGTDARNFLLGKVVPLKLGYFGVVNRSQEDLKFNRSVKDAMAFEQSFFSTIQAYHGLSHCCGVPQLANKLNQILMQHIKAILPALKTRVNMQLVAVAKEHASFGDTGESKDGLAVKLLNILAQYSEAFCSMVEGKNRVPTDELSGGARIHYIFQSIFVKRLEEVDPCGDITDQDIRIAIQNAAGPRSALFLPEAPFEILVRRQIRYLLDPSLQCARFVYEELVKMSNRCLTEQLVEYPALRRRMDEVIGNFLRERLNPAEKMITHIIDMQLDYVNTSHQCFIGGNKAFELAKQHSNPSSVSTPVPASKDVVNSEKLSETAKSLKPRAIFPKGASNVAADQGIKLQGEHDRTAPYGAAGAQMSEKGSLLQKVYSSVDGLHSSVPFFQLREPPIALKPSENQTEMETEAIETMKLLLKSYYDIVRKSIEDAIPKAIMHFLVNHIKRELHNVLIRKLYRDNLLDEMLREPDDIVLKKKHVSETLSVLEQAQRVLEELHLESDTTEKERRSSKDAAGLPKSRVGIPSTFYAFGNENDLVSSLKVSPKTKHKHKKSVHSE
ncbi:dynamin related protein [Rhynchospora pubera]|uniref:Dynamin related protein n=1 Tax=Rhynchospora pubera TaxID=906938 RepID=A0AAV8CPI3_9POAL|nr:dynamin related protein [Rhynchospora pubera]